MVYVANIGIVQVGANYVVKFAVTSTLLSFCMLSCFIQIYLFHAEICELVPCFRFFVFVN